jgi:hypothetical protein
LRELLELQVQDGMVRHSPMKTASETNIRAIIGRWTLVTAFIR